MVDDNPVTEKRQSKKVGVYDRPVMAGLNSGKMRALIIVAAIIIALIMLYLFMYR